MYKKWPCTSTVRHGSLRNLVYRHNACCYVTACMLHKVSEQAKTEEKDSFILERTTWTAAGRMTTALALPYSVLRLKNHGIGLRRYFYTNMLRMSGTTKVSDTPSLCSSLLASTTENVGTFTISPNKWTHASLQSLISYHLNVKGKL